MRRHFVASLGLVVALLLAACGGGSSPTPAPATVAPPTAPASQAPASSPAVGNAAVTIAGFAFAPATLAVKAGASVTWTNEDSATHTVKWEDGSPASGSLTSGGSPYSRTFDAPGTFAYVCGIHSSMKGTVVVEP